MKLLGRIAEGLAWLVVALGAIAFGLGDWVVDNFGQVTPDQALMNLRGAGGEGGGGKELIRDGILQTVVLPLGLVISAWVLTRAVRRRMKTRGARRSAQATYVVPAVAAIVVPVIGVQALDSALQLRAYFAAEDPTQCLERYYVTPELIESHQETPTNLILIYLESIEDAFSDAATFGANMLESLENVTEGWDSIESLDQYPGGGWTMAGIVSTQCGLPLRLPSPLGAESSDPQAQARPLNRIAVNAYLPNAVCLGDVLAEQGYKSVFLGGANIEFASKGQFLSEHGYGKVLGRKQWEEMGETEITEAWGLSDRRLLELAKTEALNLRDLGEPFALTLLTLDTHEPTHLYDYCETTNEIELTDVTRCSIDAVADFLHFLDEEGFLENTAVVVMGDHLKFTPTKKSYGDELNDYPDRTIFNRVWSPSGKRVRVHRVDQLDVFPTLLEVLGWELMDGRAGLGVSAYNSNRPPRSLRQLSAEDRERLVRSRSTSFYEELWSNEKSH